MDAPRSNDRPRKKTKSTNARKREPEALEAGPVLHAVREYARKTHSIGALQGAYALRALVDDIKRLELDNPELNRIIASGERAVEELRSYVQLAYGDR